MDLLSRLPPSILKARVFPCLCHDDIANVNLASRGLFCAVAEAVESAEIIREERFATRMAYLPWGVNFGASVSQRQPFRFLLRTASGTIVQVNIKLSNTVWDERHNSRTMTGCRDIANPSSTTMDIEIWRKQGNCAVELFFKYDADYYESASCVCHTPACCYTCLGFSVAGLKDEQSCSIGDTNSYSSFIPKYELVEHLPTDARDNVRHAMSYIYACSQHVARFPDGKIYPTPEYMMSMLPSHLRPYFPPAISCNDWIDGSREGKYPKDRDVVVEWDYRPARTRDEWYFVLVRKEGTIGKMSEFQLDELPWYKRGYWPHIKPPIDCAVHPIHHTDTLWGNVFVPMDRLALGCESIHFVSPGKAFLSYESQRMYESGDYPDDRLRVYFQNVSYDGRTFRGKLPNAGPLPFEYFDYILTFDSRFTTIVSGEATGYLTGSRRNSNPTGIQDKDFSVTILVNAGLWNRVDGQATTRPEEHATRDQKISSLLACLQEDGANDKHISAVCRITTAQSDPVDYSFDFW